jgi:hypothetical protein
MNINKPVKIFEYLLLGMPIKKNEHVYYLSEDNYLCEEMDHYKGNKFIKKVLVKVNFGDFGLNSFIKWANSFTDEEVFLMGCSKVLTDINRKKRR